MNITIDGQTVEVNNPNETLVEVAKQAGAKIPSPFYLAKR